MFRSIFRYNCSLRPSVAFNRLIPQKTVCGCETVRKRSSASELRLARQKGQCFAQYLSQARFLSSGSHTSGTYWEEQDNRLKNDPEIRAWMNQIAQDFETGKEPFQISNSEQTFTSASTANVHQRDVDTTKASSSDDIEIEDFGYLEDDEAEYDEVEPERHIPISLERGQHGVFDVEEMVTVLEHENGIDIQVIDIPPEVRFVDHMVVVSGKSLRHMRAIAASIEWLYKRKKKRKDRPFKLEGRDCRDWFAMDLGNIAVHIFTPEARQHYDIETLWRLGPEHDDRRHYVEDDHLNLSAEDLFWLEIEAGGNQAPGSQVAKDGDENRRGENQTGNSVEERSDDQQTPAKSSEISSSNSGKKLHSKTSDHIDSRH